MQRPPKQKSARGGGPGTLLENKTAVKITHQKDNPSTATHQVLVTAIPAGEYWRLKAVSSCGSIRLPAIFGNRLEALGAGVLVANHCGGRVVP